MMNLAKRWISAGRITACWFFTPILCGPTLGQDRDSVAVSEVTHRPIPAQARASYLLGDYELVADGEFYSFPAASPEELRALQPEDALLRFRIHRLYKGAAPESIEIEFVNDMLVFPGEDVSRYAMRWQILKAKDLEPFEKQLDALERSLEAGEIDRLAYELERERLYTQIQQRFDRDGLASTRMISVLHAQTFYDLGGAIRPNERYLIGADRTLDRIHVYRLEDFHHEKSQGIYWGEMREDVAAALDGLTR